MEQDTDSQTRTVKLRVPPAAYTHPIIALGATRAETEMIWTEKFPRLYGYNLVDRAKPGAVVLGEDPVARNQYGPRLLMAVQNVGKGRTMAFTSDTTRSWGRDFETIWGERIDPALPLTEQNCDSRYYRQFWVNAVRWLAAGRIGRTNNPVSLELAQSFCQPAERVAANIKVQDEELQPISGADVFLHLAVPGQTNLAFKAAFDRVTQTYQADVIAPADGNFMVTAAAWLNGRKLGEDRQLLVCQSMDREMADLRAKPDLMANLARASGGQAYSLSDPAGATVAAMFGNPPPASTEYRRTPLWDRWWWLGLIILLLTVEWSVRRWNGLA
jgi:hypothetical protein